MKSLRQKFEDETGLESNNCTGLGDYSGLQRDSEIDAKYIKWLEDKLDDGNSKVNMIIEIVNRFLDANVFSDELTHWMPLPKAPE